MGAVPYVAAVDRTDGKHTLAEINLDELQEAREDPEVKALLKEAAAEGARIKREGRQRW